MLTKPSQVSVSVHKVYAEDGIELDSLLFEPKTKTKKIVIHVHGKEGHFIQNHFTTYMGYTYPLHGYSFLAFNNRGHDYIADLLKRISSGYVWELGGSVYDILENASYDLKGVIDYVLNLGYEEVILQGHSLGPHKISYFLANNNVKEVSKLIFLTTADVRHQFDSSVPEWEKWSFVAKKMIDEGKGKDLMPIRLWSNCPVSAATFWNYTNPDTNCFVFNGTHPELEYKNFNKLTLPMLIINPENDHATGINPEKFIELLEKNSASKSLTTHIIKNAVHNFASKEEELLKVITDWLDK